MTTASHVSRRRRVAESPLPEVLGRTVLGTGEDAWIVSSASDPSRPRIVREVGPSGQLVCGLPGMPGCPASQYRNLPCRHVAAVSNAIIRETLLSIKARNAATAARLDKMQRDRRETSSTRPRNDDPAPGKFSIWK